MATPKDDFKNSFNVATYLQAQPLDKLKKLYHNISYDYAVAVLNLNGGLNCASIIRSSCIFGCQKVFIFGQKNFDANGMVGAQHYIDVQHIKDSLKEDKTVDEKKFLDVMKKEKLTPIFIEQGGVDASTLNWRNCFGNSTKQSRICFVFGNESKGVSSNILQTGNEFPGSCTVSIRQPGILRSLNVSVCAGVVLQMYYEKVLAKRLDYLNLATS